ncbi:MAG: DUF3021 family protein [Clostridia bacterium]|nr:DUF3021 family protein [Clostridia bacterium]
MDKIISSFRKAASRLVWAYSICVIILALGSYAIGGNVAPKNIFILTWMYLCFIVISTVILSLDRIKKWERLPYLIKRLAAMPFMMSVAVLGIMNLGEIKRNFKTNLAITVVLFGVVYIIASAIGYVFEKKQTDKMNDALMAFQKEIAREDE